MSGTFGMFSVGLR